MTIYRIEIREIQDPSHVRLCEKKVEIIVKVNINFSLAYLELLNRQASHDLICSTTLYC